MENFTSKNEKSVFSNLFGNNSDSSSESDSEDPPEQSSTEVSSETTLTVFSSKINHIRVEMVEERAKGIAHQLWPAANFMCNYLESHVELILNKHCVNILELGAGVGLCGLFIAKMCCQALPESHANVVLTDLDEALERLNINITLNNLNSTVSARILQWGNDSDFDAVFSMFSSPPLVIAADCVYWECLFAPLFKTIKQLVNRGCVVLISHVKRWKRDAKFFSMCRKDGMQVEVLVETVEMIPAEHTGIPTRTITRVYRISAGGGSTN